MSKTGATEIVGKSAKAERKDEDQQELADEESLPRACRYGVAKRRYHGAIDSWLPQPKMVPTTA